MIYTVTFNPSIDLFVEADIEVGELNRVRKEEYMAGGKGLNVSMVCNQLQMETIATGFLGGFTGNFVKEELEKEGIAHHFIEADGITRINMKIAGIDETEINLTGVNVNREQFEKMYQYLNENLTNEDALVISGNSARGIDRDDYATLCKLANEKNALLVVDTNQAYLEGLLQYKPFLIKPNVAELAGVFKTSISNEDDIVEYARKLQGLGAQNVLVSNGSKGAILVSTDGVYFGEPIKGKRVNSIGAGDSMVAGFVCEWINTKDYSKSLKMGLVCGALTAFSERLARRNDILERLPEAVVTYHKL